MTASVSGRFFLPGSARFVPARAQLAQDKVLRVEDGGGAVLAVAPLNRIEVSARLGKLARRFDIPGGGRFETDDNDAADALLVDGGRGKSRLHHMEKSWRWAASSLAVAAVVVYAFVVYGIPALALWLAEATPPAANGIIARQALQVLDRALLSPSELGSAEHDKAQRLFARVAALGKRGAGGYRLLLRASKRLGPNALALPDGTIVMTDALWQMVRADDEAEGVFAHEMAHIDRAHSLQRLYQAAIVPAAIAFVTGDISQVTQLATLLPGILVQAAYTRDLEQQADDDAAVALKRLGGNPAHLADLLDRVEKNVCGKQGCGSGWLGDHPETDSRSLRLRRGGVGEKKNSL